MEYPRDNVFTFLFSTYRRTATVVFAAILIVAIPVTLYLINQNQDIRQRAAGGQLPGGYFDGLYDSNCSVNGWAYDPDEPTKSITVHVYKDGPGGNQSGTFIGATTANMPRPDVNNAHIPGDHGFNMILGPDTGLHDGQPHKIYIYAIDSQGGTNALLQNSPKTITCSSPPKPLIFNCGSIGDVNGDGKISIDDAKAVLSANVNLNNLSAQQKQNADTNGDGKVDVLDALLISRYSSGYISTFPVCPANKPPVGYLDGAVNSTCTINGWAADPDDTSKNLQVHIYVDGTPGTFVGATTANQSRPDVEKAGYPGNHGYSFTFTKDNSKIVDGKDHQVYAYAIDSSDTNQHSLLVNAPKTITCASSTTAGTTVTPVPSTNSSLFDLNDDGKIDLKDINILYYGFAHRQGD